MNDAIQEYYDFAFGLSDQEQAKVHLIYRYQDKVSARLIKEKYELREKARGSFSKHIGKLMSRPNPFLQLIKKTESFSGKYIPMPILNHSDGNIETMT